MVYLDDGWRLLRAVEVWLHDLLLVGLRPRPDGQLRDLQLGVGYAGDLAVDDVSRGKGVHVFEVYEVISEDEFGH